MGAYIEDSMVRDQLGIGEGAQNADTIIARVVASAERAVNRRTRRVFTLGESQTRIFTPLTCSLAFIGDYAAVTKVETDTRGDGTFATEWEEGGWRLTPYNAEQEGRPYDTIEVAPGGAYVFTPNARGSLRVTGQPGWAETPDDIIEACLLIATRLYKRKDSPLGVAGFGDMGALRVSYDADIDEIITDYTRPVIA